MENTAIEGISNGVLAMGGLVALVLFACLESRGSVVSFVSTLIKVILWTGGIIGVSLLTVTIAAMLLGLAAGVGI